MILNAIQNANSFYIYKDKGSVMMRSGFLVSFTATCYSYVTSKGSQLILVCDGNGHILKSFNAPKAVKSGLGW